MQAKQQESHGQMLPLSESATDAGVLRVTEGEEEDWISLDHHGHDRGLLLVSGI